LAYIHGIRGVTERPNHLWGWEGDHRLLERRDCNPPQRFGGEDMEDIFSFQDRRDSIRLKMIYPAIYTRFDSQGRPYDQKISQSMNVSQGGVRLQSSFLVGSGEVLDITMALEENLVTFQGEVIYVKPSEDESFELGISIKDMENQDKNTLTRFIENFRGSGPRWDA
jgi:hypothetical protein